MSWKPSHNAVAIICQPYKTETISFNEKQPNN